MDLRKSLLEKIEELGSAEAAAFFGTSEGNVKSWQAGKTNPSLPFLQKLVDVMPTNGTAPAPEELFTWEGKDVIILLPVYRTFSADTHFTLFVNYAKYGMDKVGLIQEKRTVIHEARNILVHKFLKTQAKWAIMFDDDMILPCGNAALFTGRYGAKVSAKSAGFNTISRLMSHPEDKLIVGSLYFGRHAKGQAQCCSGFNEQGASTKFRRGEHQGLKAEEWVAMGGIRIHRSVFERMIKAIDEGKWPDLAPRGVDGWYGFFNPFRVRQGEDTAFCLRAKELGIQSYVDASLVLLHEGSTMYGPHNTHD